MISRSVAAFLLLLSAGMCLGQSLTGIDLAAGPPSEPKKPIIFDLSAIDKTADPCTDFYQYACGNWLKKNPVPADQVRWGRFNELAERNNYLLYTELKSAADAPKTPLQKKYGDYFAACMNVDVADKLGAEPVQPVMTTIESLEDKKQLAAMVAELQSRFAVSVFYVLGVQQDQKDSSQQIVNAIQGGLSLPDRSYYLTDDARSQKIRYQYVDHVTKMFVLLGDTPERAAEEAKSVMSIETALAKGSTDRVEALSHHDWGRAPGAVARLSMASLFNRRQDRRVQDIECSDAGLLQDNERGDRCSKPRLDQELSAMACAENGGTGAVEAICG